MQRHNWPRACLGTLICLATAVAHGAPPSGDPSQTTQTCAVKDTYNNRPFEYQSKLLARRDGFRVYRLTYPSPVLTPIEQNNTIRADFYLPDEIKRGDSRRPAVIVLHVLDGDMRLTDVACSVLARRGVPAIMPTLPYYGERAKPEGWKALLRDPKLFVDMACQSIEDNRRTLDLLASRPEIDARRIDITGVSLGGILGASAAATEPRFHRAVLLLAGGDLMTILKGAHEALGHDEVLLRDVPRFQDWIEKLPPGERAAIVARIHAFDPLTLAPALRQRAQRGQVLMINVLGDEVIPNACTRKLAAALGISDQVVWLYGQEHETFTVPEALCRMVEFVAQDLPPGAKAERPAIDPSTPAERAATFLHQVRAMLTTEPDRGHRHLLEVEISATTKNKTQIETRVRFARGANKKFALKCRMPIVGDVTLGQGEFPWMVGIDKTVIAGVEKPSKNHNPLSLADPRKVAALRALAGLSATLDMIRLDTLHYWIDIQDATAPEGGPALRIVVNEKYPGSILLCFQKDGKTPSKIVFKVAGVSGKITVRRWQINALADETLFIQSARRPAGGEDGRGQAVSRICNNSRFSNAVKLRACRSPCTPRPPT